jgi:hypothetical protein
VSVYALEPGGRQVLAVWPAGVGSLAQPVLFLPPSVPEALASELCAALTALSKSLWATYARPDSAAADDDERSRREQEQDGRDRVLEALRVPNLPDEFGVLVVSHIVVEESAHQLGRLLHGLGDLALTEAVAADVAAELAAVTSAELGDLSGRAGQATALDRLDVSPVQVAAADQVLRADPLGVGLLTALVDPTAACVAAARWLAAAAMVAADVADLEAADVFAEADSIEAVSVAVPAEVVARIVDDGADARVVVLDLLRNAVAVGDGVILDLPRVVAQQQAMGADQVRATELDPRRPARDLLEHLLSGIAACFLVYADFDDSDGGFELEDDPDPGSARRDRMANDFADLVRAQAASVSGN